MTMRVAVCASGGGSNLQALLDDLTEGAPARVVSSRRQRSQNARVPATVAAS